MKKINKLVSGFLDDSVPLTGEQLLARLHESPEYYAGPVVYQKDDKFRRITRRNFSDYEILDQDTHYVYTVVPSLAAGHVFQASDLEHITPLGILPVLSLELRDTDIKGYKQAFHLRIRQAHAMQGVATRWYLAYVDKHGGIVSDFEHLEGGKHLWRSFVNTAELRGLHMHLVDTDTGDWTPVNAATPDSLIWSLDDTLKRKVLVLEK